MTNPSPVELLQEAATQILAAATAWDEADRIRIMKELALTIPAWIGVQDQHARAEELQRQLNDLSASYNDIEQTLIDALNADSLEPLKALAAERSEILSSLHEPLVMEVAA